MKSELLYGLVKDYTSLSLAGMCKNAGKTTVLNRILQDMGKKDVSLALTSIGRDGESTDVVTGTGKPRIYVREGTLFATAAGLLHNCDTTGEILRTTGIHTPLGEVILLRARSDGFIDLAGPSMNQQLIELSTIFKEYGPEKILIDGAISRKSLCSRRVTEAVILCTGASYHKDMGTVIDDTVYVSNLLQLRAATGSRVRIAIEGWQGKKAPNEKLLLLDWEGSFRIPEPGKKPVDVLRDKEVAKYPIVWMEGAMTDAAIKPLLMSNISLKGRMFMVEDSSKILLNREVCEKLYKKGAELTVLSEIALLAITVNPFSAYGNHFDKTEFAARMQEAVALPVIDVME